MALDDISASLVRDSVELLAERSPALGRPAVGRITGSSLHCSSSTRNARLSCWWQATRPETGPAGTATPSSWPRTLRPLPGHLARGDPTTEHYRWETALNQRRRADPGIDDPDRRAAARDIRNARDIGCHLAQMRKQRGMTQAEVARAMGVSQARVFRMEHGDVEKMQVESVAAYVAAIGGHLRLVADFDQATTTFIDYTDALTA